MANLLRSILIGAIVLAAVPVYAQNIAVGDAPEINPDDAPPSARATGNTPAGVSVPDSPGATDKLQKARDKEDRKQWKAAAEFYQEAIEQYGRRVLPAKVDADQGIYQYQGVAQLVQERLAKWPQEGLLVYCGMYGQTAADQLAAAKRDETAALDNVFSTWFVTDAGKTAGIRLMDLHMEAGQFSAAAWIGDRLLTLHPTLGADRGMVLFRCALAHDWSGDLVKASSLLEELKLKNANDTGSIGGKDVMLVDALTAALKAPAPQPSTQPGAADSWPGFGGPGGRGEISSSTAKPGAGLKPILLAPPDFRGAQFQQPQQREQLLAMDRQEVVAGQMMGIMPGADHGELFFQDGRRMYAVNADSGLPLEGWSQTYRSGNENNAGRYLIDTFGRARGQQLTVTVTDSRVLAVMGQPDRTSLMFGQAPSPSDRVVCLDRQTGKLQWSRATADLPETVTPLRSAQWNGSPLVIGNDSVLVIARGGQGNQFEDAYVICLSISTGEYKWSTYVGSASEIFDGDFGGTSIEASEMSIADGRVFVLSNLGTVAAIDPYDGRLIWLNAYPRSGMDNPNLNPMFFRGRMNPNGQNVSKPWAYNPVIVSGGKVFVLPSDGKHLLVYDAGTGAELKRISTGDYDNMDVLLGVKGDWIVATSNNGCYCIDWSKYNRDKPEDALLWNSILVEENAVVGRGFVTADSVFIPTQQKLEQISLDRFGRLLSVYPASGTWSSDQGPGNVVVTSHNVIVAGSTRVDVYTDLALVRQRYENLIAAAPTDPQPRVRFAEVLFAGGQAESALGKLDEAINLIDGINAMQPGKDRETIYATAMTFAIKQAKTSAGDNIVGTFFDRAGAAAQTPAQKASYRLERAKFDADQHDYTDAVKLAQEILSDDAMRAANVSENTSGGTLAEAAINEAIHADRSCYKSIEEMADISLETAKAGNDPVKLLAVATVYPNSKAAGEARLAAASLFEAGGDHTQAIESLRQSYAVSDRATRTLLLEAMVRNFLAIPNGVGPAIDRLTQGSRAVAGATLSKPLVLPDGTTLKDVPFTDAVKQLRAIQAQADAAALPDFHIPPPPMHSHKEASAFVSPLPPVIANVSAIVRPPLEFSRNDRLVTWSPAGLAIYQPGQTTSACSTSGITTEPRGCAWMDKRLIVWNTNELLLLNDDGTVSWKTSITNLPALAVAAGNDAVIDDADTAVANDENEVIINGPARVIVRNGQRFIIRGGNVQFIGGFPGNVNPPPQQAAPPVAGEAEQIAAVYPAGKRIVAATSSGKLLGLDPTDGKVIWQLRLVDRAIDQVLVNLHFTVARLDDAGGSQIVVMDTSTGRVIGRRKFGAEGLPNQLVNVALSEEATLVYTLVNHLIVKDLYEPWKSAPTQFTGNGTGDVMSFAGLNQPNQLLVRAGRVICLYDGGKFARVCDLAGSGQPGNPLGTGAGDDPATVSLRLAGERLYISNSKTLWQYNLTDPTDHYSTDVYDLDFAPRITDLFLGQRDAILLDDPIDRGPAGSSFCTLLIYGRWPVDQHSTKESGMLDYCPTIKDLAGITKWQPVDGGLYYLTGDQKLHFLPGVGQ